MDCPLEDSTLSIHIKGSLPDGTVFWDTRNNIGGGESAPLSEVPGGPYEFATGEGLVRTGSTQPQSPYISLTRNSLLIYLC